MDVMMRRRELMGMQGVLKTVSGPIVTVNDALARNAKSLVVNFAPIQAAGTPAPDNVLPISGWTGVTGYRAGKNLFDETTVEYSKWTTSTGTVIVALYGCISGKIPVVGNSTYTFKPYGNTPYSYSVMEYSADGTFIRRRHTTSSQLAVNLTADTDYIKVQVSAGGTESSPMTQQILASYKMLLCKGSTPPPTYAPYTGTTYPVDWTDTAGTVYGGYVDLVSGVLVADRTIRQLTTSARFISTESVSNVYVRDFLPVGQSNYPGLCTHSVVWDGKGSTPATPYAELGSRGSRTLNWLGIKTAIGASDHQDFIDWLSTQTVMFIVPLATPQTYQLTPQTIAMLAGTNNVWSNANGNVELTYYAQ